MILRESRPWPPLPRGPWCRIRIRNGRRSLPRDLSAEPVSIKTTIDHETRMTATQMVEYVAVSYVDGEVNTSSTVYYDVMGTPTMKVFGDDRPRHLGGTYRGRPLTLSAILQCCVPTIQVLQAIHTNIILGVGRGNAVQTIGNWDRTNVVIV